FAVAVEVGRAGDRPDGGHVADDGGLHDLRAVHEPDAEIADGVAPQQVMFAVAVKIALPDDRPGQRGCPTDHARLQNLRAVHQPDADFPVVVAPQDVAPGVAVEVVGRRARAVAASAGPDRDRYPGRRNAVGYDDERAGAELDVRW